MEAAGCHHAIHLVIIAIGLGIEQLEELTGLIAGLKHGIIYGRID